MEPAAKKPRVADSPADPFQCLHLHINDLILQHLPPYEIIDNFEVSTLWSKVIGDSSAAMKQLELIIDPVDCDIDFDLNALMDSKRKYQHIVIREFIRPQKYNKLLRKFSASLVSLNTLFDVPVAVDIQLPLLKSLSILDEGGSFYDNGILSIMNDLKSLNIPGITKNTQVAIDFIKKSQELESLVIEPESSETIFIALPPEVPFKLKKLTCLVNERIHKNFLNFLEFQADSLEEVAIGGCSKEVFAMLYEMPNMKTVHCNLGAATNIDGLDLKPNYNIVNLTLPYVNSELLKLAIHAAPNLNNLFVGLIVPETFHYIVRNAKSLRELKYMQFAWDVKTDYVELYEKMKKREGDNINSDIRLRKIK